MIYSDLAGKNGVREDVFTSNCLGLLNLLGGRDVLSFFRAAKDLHEEPLVVGNCQIAEVTLEFWPYLRGGGIPDVIVTIDSRTASPFRIVVEVKHGAGKSGLGEDDQLARYWRAANNLYPGKCAVVYLTHDRGFPKQDIQQSLERAKDGRIFWLSWYYLFSWVDTEISSNSSRSPLERRILAEIRRYLDANGYRIFLGWRASMPGFAVTSYRRYYTPPAGSWASPIYHRYYGPIVALQPLPNYVRRYSHSLTILPSFPYNPQPME